MIVLEPPVSPRPSMARWPNRSRCDSSSSSAPGCVPAATSSVACVSVNVAKNRFGPPGRQTEIEIRYLAETEIEPALERYAIRDVAEPLDSATASISQSPDDSCPA